MRVAFELFGGSGWTGGIHYLANLFSAIADLPGRPIEPVLFVGLDEDQESIDKLLPWLNEPPKKAAHWNNRGLRAKFRFGKTILYNRDKDAEKLFRSEKIDLVFVHARWYGRHFGLPTMVWMGDFQHRHLSDMFSTAQYWKREIGFRLLIKSGTTLVTSSEAGRAECSKFFPNTLSKTYSLPFSVRIPKSVLSADLTDLQSRYNLPDRYLYLPNQFWRHKNHLGVINALKLLTGNVGKDIKFIATGNMSDGRNLDHIGKVRDLLRKSEMGERFRVLGMIPHNDTLAIIRASIAVVNPSFYEGWSTTVEEAKALGAPLLLSDIPVHREQDPAVCRYFNPDSPEDMAKVFQKSWEDWSSGPNIELERKAINLTNKRRVKFARQFHEIATKTIEKHN